MEITDKLRKLAKALNHWWYNPLKDEYTCTTSITPPSIHAINLASSILAIADRIDAAHEEAIASVMNDALYHANDKDMADLGWVRLPVDGEAPCKQLGEWIEKRGLITGPLDHDGELWHKGDMSASPWGEIASIVFDGQCWQVRGHDTSAPWLPADSLLHYHGPTVEDVLHSFICDVEEDVRDEREIIAEYAAKLRLADDGKEQ